MLFMIRQGYANGEVGRSSFLPAVLRTALFCAMLVVSGEAVRSAGAADAVSAISQTTSSANVFSRLRAFDAITPLFVNSDISFEDENAADIDFRISDQLVPGGVSGLINSVDNGDFSVGIRHAGERELSFYGAYSQDNFFIDGMVGIGRSEYDLDRDFSYALQPGMKRSINEPVLNQNAKLNETETEKFFVGLGMGYRFSAGAFSLTPSLYFDYTDVDMAGLGGADSGLAVADDSLFDENDQRFKSLTSTLGGQMAYSMNQEWGVLVPFGRIEWVHEFEDDVRSYTSQLLDQSGSNVLSGSLEDSDRDYFNLGLGVSAQFGSGRAAFLSYEQVFGKEDADQYSITGGVRFEF